MHFSEHKVYVSISVVTTDMLLRTETSSSPAGSASHTNTTSVEIEDDGGHGDELDENDLEPIVICGFSIKFPEEATSPDDFWKMMCKKRCAMTDFHKSRMNKIGLYRKQDMQNTVRSLHLNLVNCTRVNILLTSREQMPLQEGHFIREDLGAFSADFFSMSPVEAASLDTMHRWLLEAVTG